MTGEDIVHLGDKYVGHSYALSVGYPRMMTIINLLETEFVSNYVKQIRHEQEPLFSWNTYFMVDRGLRSITNHLRDCDRLRIIHPGLNCNMGNMGECHFYIWILIPAKIFSLSKVLGYILLSDSCVYNKSWSYRHFL